MTGYQKNAPGRLASVILNGWPVFLAVLLVLVSGLLVGSMSAGRMDRAKAEDLSNYIRDFVQKVGEVNFDPARIAKSAMINNAITVAAMYILGLTVIGIPVTLAILFVRGFVIGFTVGFLTGDMSLGGVILTLSAVLPHNLLHLPAVCFGASASVMFSLLLLKRNFDTAVRIWPGLIRYTAVMGFVLAVTLGAGLVEGYITPAITRLAAGLIVSGQGLR
ncbi:MAG: stage II sporulation protein M [Peptococcaceae bacterium]|nr:stage II sporulation protein M [Peptococcaceae bacterium]